MTKIAKFYMLHSSSFKLSTLMCLIGASYTFPSNLQTISVISDLYIYHQHGLREGWVVLTCASVFNVVAIVEYHKTLKIAV